MPFPGMSPDLSTQSVDKSAHKAVDKSIWVLDRAGLDDELYPHIRPLGVSPLNNPERVLKPWGFFFLGRCPSVIGARA